MYFDNYYDRSDDGASKWLIMRNKKSKIASGVIPMSIADMEFPLCKEIREEIIEYVSTKVLGYTRPNQEYLESVVNFMDRIHKYKIKKEWIVTSPGVVTGLATAIRAFTQPGDGVLIFTPVYSPFYEVIRDQGRKVIECELYIKDNRYYIDFNMLEKLIEKSSIKLLLFCSPHNPSGRVWDRKELEQISDICNKRGVILVSDEIHCDLVFNEKKHHIYSSVDMENKSIVCTAASKTYNIAGLQNSNIIIKNEELREKFLKEMYAIGIERANILGMVATKAAYNKCDYFLWELREFIGKQHKIVEDFCEKHNDKLTVMKAESSFLSWISFEKIACDSQSFFKELEEQDLFVTPGSDFGKSCKKYFRLNLGIPQRKLLEALERLEKVIKKF